MNKLVLSTIAAACLSSTAFAAASAVAATGVTSGAVLGLQGGFAAIQSPSAKALSGVYGNMPGTYSADKGDFSYGAYAGYLFAVSHNVLLGPTLGYTFFGHSEYKAKTDAFGQQKAQIKSQAASLLAKGLYVFDNGVDVNASAGMAYVTQKYTGQIFGKVTRHAFKPELGLGAGYEFENGLGLGLATNYIFGETKNRFVKKPYAVAGVNADVSYKFD